MAPDAFEILALRHVEGAMAGPVAQRALVEAGEARDVLRRTVLRDAAAALADDDRALALVIELRRFRRAVDRLAMADERARRAQEDVGIFRHVEIGVFGIAVGIIDADADDFLRRRNGRQERHRVERMVGRGASGQVARPREPIRRGEERAQIGALSGEPAADIDDALARHRAEASAARNLERQQLHGILPVLTGSRPAC